MKNEKKIKRGILAICGVISVIMAIIACIYIFSGSVELMGEGFIILTLVLGIMTMASGFYTDFGVMFYLGIGVMLDMLGCLLILDGFFYGKFISVGGIVISVAMCLKEFRQ